MSLKPLTLLACVLAAALLVLPACGGDDETQAPEPAADTAPRADLDRAQGRVRQLEQEVERLRRELESLRAQQSSADEPGHEAGAGADAGDTAGAAGAPGGASAAPGAGGGAGSAGAGPAGGSGS